MEFGRFMQAIRLFTLILPLFLA
ncbi:energy transducer TonB, partial [Acinetobacter baumannii]|nr:energy transducer TonB [Acinetobacter baumannii]